MFLWKETHIPAGQSIPNKFRNTLTHKKGQASYLEAASKSVSGGQYLSHGIQFRAVPDLQDNDIVYHIFGLLSRPPRVY